MTGCSGLCEGRSQTTIYELLTTYNAVAHPYHEPNWNGATLLTTASNVAQTSPLTEDGQCTLSRSMGASTSGGGYSRDPDASHVAGYFLRHLDLPDIFALSVIVHAKWQRFRSGRHPSHTSEAVGSGLKRPIYRLQCGRTRSSINLFIFRKRQ